MDALIKGNDLNKLKERVMLNKLNEGEWVKKTNGKRDVLNKLRGNSLRLCLVPGKYKGKKRNAKENDFLIFGYPMKNIKENQI